MSYRNECKYGDSCGFDFCVPEYCKDFEPAQMSNADHIRAATDEELVDFLWQFNTDSFENVMPFCQNTVECVEKLDSNDISTEMCKRCLLTKLQQPYESEKEIAGEEIPAPAFSQCSVSA